MIADATKAHLLGVAKAAAVYRLIAEVNRIWTAPRRAGAMLDFDQLSPNGS